MKIKNLLSIKVVLAACLLLACEDQLDVGNPNQPTLGANVTTESGLTSLAQGGVYINGFNLGDGWLGNSYFSLPYGYSELLGDVVGAQASNQLVSTLSIPDYFELSDGTRISNPASSIALLRSNNTRAQTGSGYNPTYYQWLNMYSLNNACNTVLTQLDKVAFTGDAESKANTFRAWCYWWKGYAYASIGSMYYAGLIIDEILVTNGDYVTHDAIIAQSNSYFAQAAATLDAITSTADFTSVLTNLIPEFTRVGHGGVLTIDMWKRNINTMLARNILVNKLAPFVNGNPDATISKSSTSVMTAADWNQVLTLATAGIQEDDFVFTGRSVASNGFFTASGGTVAALTTGPNAAQTFRLSERFVQYFKPDDARFTANFNMETTYKDDLTFGTRYSIDDGLNEQGVYDYGSKAVGEYELYIAGSYEENTLMRAEASIRLGNIDEGLSYVDMVRDYMGAGLDPVAGTGLGLSEALTELVSERRVALVFRGLSFYDYRRWGFTYDIANGGGSYGNTIYLSDGTVDENVTINYNFLDYWDVPANEADLNPSVSEVATINPNF
jgi:hypothetical protein